MGWIVICIEKSLCSSIQDTIATYLKIIYSEKATKLCKISTVDLSYVVQVKSTVEISQNFVAFSNYMNLKYVDREHDSA